MTPRTYIAAARVGISRPPASSAPASRRRLRRVHRRRSDQPVLPERSSRPKNRAITTGCTSTTLYCPTDNVSRLAMAAFMNRLGDALTPEVKKSRSRSTSDALGEFSARRVVEYKNQGAPGISHDNVICSCRMT